MKNSILLFAFLTIMIGLNCNKSNDFAPQANNDNVALSGSYAKSLIIGERLFIVTKSDMVTFDISAPDKPKEIDRQPVGNQIESLYYFKEKLFVGSGQGMFIYAVDTGKPIQLSSTNYSELFNVVYPCDPILATDSYAYVTLNTSIEVSICRRTGTDLINQLNVFDITDLAHPQLVGEYPMQAPKGLAKDGDNLFVCNGKSGVTIFNTSNPLSLTEIGQLTGFEAYDAIVLEGLLLVIGPNNVYQFDISDVSNITKISQISHGI